MQYSDLSKSLYSPTSAVIGWSSDGVPFVDGSMSESDFDATWSTMAIPFDDET